MAIKIEKIGNFNVFTDTATGVITRCLSEFPTWDEGNDNEVFYFKDTQQDYTFHYNFSDLVDGEGVAWGDVSILKTWLSNKVGISGTVDVLLQDSTSPIFIVEASNLIAETTTTTLGAIDDYIINVADATGFVVGQYMTVYMLMKKGFFFEKN